MKLYATVASERASKGQGGNEYLIVDLTVENDGKREPIGQIELVYKDDRQYGVDLDEWVLQYRPEGAEEWQILNQGNVKR